MATFHDYYKQLNRNQRTAVDTIDGPLLVIAGPGTGKTQLLVARVANILKQTDTPAQNVLCLTFTESGARNMRERLAGFIGQTAYDVNIATYHAFGGDLIRRFPDYFAETRLQNPVDELDKRQILLAIVENMSYHNPLKQTRHHIGDLMSTLSEVKRALLDGPALRAIAADNAAFITSASRSVAAIFEDFVTMPRSVGKAAPYFQQTLQTLLHLAPAAPLPRRIGSLATIAADELKTALDDAAASNKTTTLTQWKNTWLAKNDDNHFIFGGQLENQRIEALANVYEQYQAALAAGGLYDFDDMIIRAIEALEKHIDLKYSLQERYLYILLDELQDTNAAQLRLVQLLSDNPVHEGRPDIMAVGDDDQAIYAFQGAQYSNMLDFYRLYRDVQVVNLTENYRSRAAILTTAQNLAEQIDSRLQDQFPGTTKALRAANEGLPTADINRVEFLSEIAEYDWIARHTKKLIDDGVAPSEIAVLAPKHKHLEPLVPYLNALGVPVRYEKRENILEAPVIRQLLTMSRLVLALQAGNQDLSNALWPVVLSFDFWHIPTAVIWQLSWQISDSRGDRLHYSKALLADPQFALPAQLLLGAAARAATETCETMLDYLIGSAELATNDPALPTVCSPLREYYSSAAVQAKQPELFYETLSHLTVMRAKLRDYQAAHETALTLSDLVALADMYSEAGQQMINSSPYSQRVEAVQLMTVFKAKGLEFEHVFLPACQDDVWGSVARSNSNKLTLPANLLPIRHAGATDDERLRLLFVAVTRAKYGLHLTSASENYTGKPLPRLKYFDEQEQADGRRLSMILPPAFGTVTCDDNAAPALELLQLDWRNRHVSPTAIATLHDLLHERTADYQLSPTHLTTFIDTAYGGPPEFFFTTLLRFPRAPAPDSQFGIAIHETLEWLQHRVSEQGSVPATQAAVDYFKLRLQAKKLTAQRTALEIERGERALPAYLASRSASFRPTDQAEKSFKNEGVFIGDAHLSGRIDRLEINRAAKTITVVDYKTGKSHDRWKSDARLHLYRRQLYCYKLLIEGSHSFGGYKVTKGRLEFVEADDHGRINTLELDFDDAELMRTRQLLEAVWQHVKQLQFPDISHYAASITGIRKLEQDLIDGTL